MRRGRGASQRRGSRQGTSSQENQESHFQWTPFSAVEKNKNTEAEFSENEVPARATRLLLFIV